MDSPKTGLPGLPGFECPVLWDVICCSNLVATSSMGSRPARATEDALRFRCLRNDMTVLVKVSAIKVIGWYYIDGITQMVLAVAVWVTFLYPFFLSIAIHLRHPHTHSYPLPTRRMFDTLCYDEYCRKPFSFRRVLRWTILLSSSTVLFPRWHHFRTLKWWYSAWRNTAQLSRSVSLLWRVLPTLLALHPLKKTY